MKIFFLHLHYHEKSKSSKWFVEIIKKTNQVVPIAIDIDYTICYEIEIARPDLVICWQTEQLVPWFISRNIAAIAIPMADGCADMPLLYYKLIGQLGSISLSQFVYERFLSAGVPSLSVKYYPKVNKYYKCGMSAERGIDIFYPFRSKRWSILNNISEALSKNMKVHVHENIDDYYEISTRKFDSYYFRDISDLNKILLNSKFFLCPRYSEGIGLSTLHAMSLGCIPIGIDGPGNCEYFKDGLGIIIPFENTNKRYISLFQDIKKTEKKIFGIRKKIYETIHIGRENFESSVEDILYYIENRVQFFHSSRNRNNQASINIMYRMVRPTTLILGTRKYKTISFLLGNKK